MWKKANIMCCTFFPISSFPFFRASVLPDIVILISHIAACQSTLAMLKQFTFGLDFNIGCDIIQIHIKNI